MTVPRKQRSKSTKSLIGQFVDAANVASEAYIDHLSASEELASVLQQATKPHHQLRGQSHNAARATELNDRTELRWSNARVAIDHALSLINPSLVSALEPFKSKPKQWAVSARSSLQRMKSCMNSQWPTRMNERQPCVQILAHLIAPFEDAQKAGLLTIATSKRRPSSASKALQLSKPAGVSPATATQPASPTDQNKALRIRIDDATTSVVIGDVCHPIRSRAAFRAFKLIHAAAGGYVNPPSDKERWDKLLKHLPIIVRALIKSTRGPGGGYRFVGGT